MHRLQTEAHTVDAGGSVYPELIFRDSARIALDSDLCARVHVPALVYRAHDARYRRAFQDGRGAAAQIYARDMIVAVCRRLRTYLPYQLVHIPRLCIVISRHGQKVAISAFPDTKGYMYIQLQRESVRCCAFLYRHHSSSSFNTLMNAFCGISTLPIWRILFLPSFCFSSSFFFLVISPP